MRPMSSFLVRPFVPIRMEERHIPTLSARIADAPSTHECYLYVDHSFLVASLHVAFRLEVSNGGEFAAPSDVVVDSVSISRLGSYVRLPRDLFGPKQWAEIEQAARESLADHGRTQEERLFGHACRMARRFFDQAVAP